MQKIEKCSTSTTAKIDVEVDGAIHNISPIVENLCGCEVSKVILLSCPQFLHRPHRCRQLD